MENPQNSGEKVSIVYLAAGISSRFGGKIKQFAQVGPEGETLIEVSMKQAVSAGINEIIFVVGEKTSSPFMEKFGNLYQGVPVKYAFQSFDTKERDRPWGTVDAVVCIKQVVKNSFLICNGDDLYGTNSFKLMQNFLIENNDEFLCASAGYELGCVLPEKGRVNRAVFSVDKNGFVIDLDEKFNIEKNNLASQNLNEKTPISMNLFALKKETLDLMEKKLIAFKSNHKNDRKSECLLPVEISNLIHEGKIKMKLLPTKDKWLGVTNPGDEVTVRNALALNQL